MHTALARKNQALTRSRTPGPARAHASIRNILRGHTLQPKLKIGAANDPAEREADAVADKVMRMPAPEPSAAGESPLPPSGNGPDPPPAVPPPSNPGPGSGPNPIRRMCSECEGEIQRQPIDEEKDELEVQRMTAGEGGEVDEEELIQPKERPGATPAMSAASESAIRRLGGGAPLAASERAFFEPRFGRDFSNIRIHSGAAADTSAKAINARAYTLGSDIAFAGGEYTAGSPSGRRLLAHELTHTIQQRASGVFAVQRHSCREGEGPPGAEPPIPEEAGPHPLIYRGVTAKRSRRPSVGDAQELLNRFLDQLGSGGFACDAGADLDAIDGIRSTLNQDPLEVDCRFGPNTEKVTEMFQRCVFPNDSDEWDGKIGENTWPELERLRPAPTPPPTPTPTPTPPEPEKPKKKMLPRGDFRVDAPSSPGWASVDPIYRLTIRGEPREFPHYLKVRVDDSTGKKWAVTAKEGRYKGKDVEIDLAKLNGLAAYESAGTIKFDWANEKLWYGGKGPVEAFTQASNPVPKGTHDLEIPDFQHDDASKYGDYATTWFRIGHSGDRYLHPGTASLGCSTIRETSAWPKIWDYLIRRRTGDDKSVGHIEVV